MQSRRQYALFLLLVAAIVAAGFWMAQRRRQSPLGVLAAVPRDAWLVVTIDAAALRASPLVQPLLGSGTAIPGLGPLTEGCGFDPVARLREVVLCSPEGGERGDFGVAFSGDFTRDELSRCADRVIQVRGGSSKATARGEYTVLEDASDAGHTRYAYRDGGPFLVGRGAWLDAMIDAASGKVERARPEHAALRTALAAKPGETPRAVVLTALLPSTVRQKLRSDLGAELGGEGERTFAAVLAVESAGLAVGVGPSGGTTDVVAELRCETPDACLEVKGLAERKRMALSRDLGVRLIGLGPLLDGLRVEASGPAVHASTHAPTDDLARAAKRLLDAKTPKPPASSPSPPASPASPSR